MFKLVVLSVVVALAAAKPSAIAPWGLGLGLGLGGHLAAPLAAPVVAAPLAAPILSAPALGAYNYRGPLSLGPGQPASIVAADGRPLDTISVNLDRAAHYTARAVDAHGLHLLKKRSAPLLAPALPLAHSARLSLPVGPIAAPLAAPIAPLGLGPIAPLGLGPIGPIGPLGLAGGLGHGGVLVNPLGRAAVLGHGDWRHMRDNGSAVDRRNWGDQRCRSQRSQAQSGYRCSQERGRTFLQNVKSIECLSREVGRTVEVDFQGVKRPTVRCQDIRYDVLQGHQLSSATRQTTMYKFIVLCAFLASAVADPQPEPHPEPQPEPGTFIAPLPISPYASVVLPASTTITNQASSVLHPSPYIINAPLAYSHFIKKRSAPLTYFSPSYVASPALATTYSAPLVQGAPLISSPYVAPLPYVAATHLIKKRSAPFLPKTYIAPTTYAGTPLLASPYFSTPYISSPLIHTAAPIIPQPVTHFIKKRSAPFIGLAPTSYSHQSRIDLHSTPLFNTPYAYSLPAAPITYPHLL
ncbi:uncharacterized protein LOC131848055 [Achroia grisella]|uniref:uncharacterized protein LOC131848055 n=1 Tax=Achroia grisella TaxID=688607 RepID=UPI0027D33EDA|nr:uncharacterized protein LOC131848055 [Achroia grisella]